MTSIERDVFKTFPRAEEFHEAHKRIGKFIHRTPVFTSRQADEKSGRCLFFKAENLQKSGSIKARGALNAILKAKELKPDLRGIVAHSSGNHGLAVAWISSIVGIPCCIVVPPFTSQAKRNAIRGYGGNLIECGPLFSDRTNTCEQLVQEKGYEYVPPYDHRDVISGQGTIALELLEQVPDLDAILVPISGGGMSSGIAAVVKQIKPSVKVYLACPPGKLIEECLRSGERPWSGPPQYLNSVADGLRSKATGQLTTPTLIRLVEKDVFEMSDDQIIQAMKFSFERMKLVVEAAAGTSIAASLSDKLKGLDPSIKNVGVIMSGGNVDIDKLPWL